MEQIHEKNIILYEVSVYDKYQTIIYRSCPLSLEFAILKAEEFDKYNDNDNDNDNNEYISIYINNIHNGKNYEHEYHNKFKKSKTIEELNIEFTIKKKKCINDIEYLYELLEKYNKDNVNININNDSDTNIYTDNEKIKLVLEN